MRKFFLIIMAILMALIVSCGGEPNGIEPDASPDASPDVTTTQGEAIAIAKLREFDPNDPDAPYTDSNTIGPLDRVYFDGRDSHLTEPIFLGGGSVAQEEIGSFYWEVLEAPEGVSSLGYKVFEWDGKKTDLPSMKVPTVGHYVVRLTVAPTLAAGTTDLDSQDTEQARIEFDAIPKSGVYIQLNWRGAEEELEPEDYPDLDLHLINTTQSSNLCHKQWSCYFRNCMHGITGTPELAHWFSDAPALEGPNPRLEKENSYFRGGPEIMNIDEPYPGAYRVFVHYYQNGPSWSFLDKSVAVISTLRIYLNGELTFEEERTLIEKDQVWAVADIEWLDDGSERGTGTVTPYPSPAPDQIGTVASGFDAEHCLHTDEGWPFPE